jgi:serine/threonine-protein kinase
VFVVDFGIAKALIDTGDERLTSTGLALGTPIYMSPEQASGGLVDARSDQYSLASVLYEMLVGEPPFTGPNAQVIIARRFAEPARAIRPLRSTIPPHIEAAVLKALERVPADRFADVNAFAAQLDLSARQIARATCLRDAVSWVLASSQRGSRPSPRFHGRSCAGESGRR